MLRPLPIFAAALALATFATSLDAAQLGRDWQYLDDETLSREPDNTGQLMEGDGLLRVAVWTDRRVPGGNSDRTVLCAVSTDRGLTWSPERVVYDQTAQLINPSDVDLAVANGVIFVSFDDDRSVGSETAVVMRSDDLGVTWSETVLASDANHPTVHADGNDVLVLWEDTTASTTVLYEQRSLDGGLSYLGPQQLTTGDVDADGWDASIDQGVFHVLWYDARPTLTGDKLYHAAAVGSAAFPQGTRVDQSGTGAGATDLFPKIIAQGSRVYVSFLENLRNGLFPEDEIYFCVSNDSGASWTEQRLTPIQVDGDEMALAADGDIVAVAWHDDRNGSPEPARVAVSMDGGVTFLPDYVVPSANSIGRDDHSNLNVFVEGGRIVLSFASEAYTSSNLDEWPAHCYSLDGGITWYGPFVMGTYDAREDISAQAGGWLFAEGSLSGVWHTDGGPSLRTGIAAAGTRFPFCSAGSVGNTAVFSLNGADTTTPGVQYARWAVSSVLGSRPHPENPAEQLNLGNSSALNYTLGQASTFAAVVDAQGNAARALPIPASAVGIFYVQAWVNVGGTATGGTTTSDVIELIL